MEHHWKKTIWPRGDSNLRRRSQSTDMLCSRPSCIPKKMMHQNDVCIKWWKKNDASKWCMHHHFSILMHQKMMLRVKATLSFPYRPNVNSHIMLTLFLTRWVFSMMFHDKILLYIINIFRQISHRLPTHNRYAHFVYRLIKAMPISSADRFSSKMIQPMNYFITNRTIKIIAINWKLNH